MPNRTQVWKNAGDRMKLVALTSEQNNGQIIIKSAHSDSVSKTVIETEYTVDIDGAIKIKRQIDISDNNLPEIPRIGIKFTLSGDFNYVSWFGRGPHESYWDRKQSAAIGLYSGSVWDQTFQYVRPQETGNKTDVYWMALEGNSTGLMAIGLPQFDGSVHQYPYEDLDYYPNSQKHGKLDITPKNQTDWLIDYRQMGVGGDNSWGAKPMKLSLIHI